MEVSLLELRAWARQSHRIAREEGFSMLAERIARSIDELELLMRDGHHCVKLVPVD